jgi:hypothetical protein
MAARSTSSTAEAAPSWMFGNQVRVAILGDRDRRVPEPLLNNLRVDLGGEEVAGVAVPQAVQRHPIGLQEGWAP